MKSESTRAVAIAAAVWAVMAPGAAAQAPTGDSVVGSLNDSLHLVRGVSIDARSGPSGAHAAGTLTWHYGGGLGPTWNASVTCLAVSGNTAVIGFSGRMAFFLSIYPTTGLIRVIDAGGPASRLDSFEWADLPGPAGGEPGPGPDDCSSYPSTFVPQATTAFNEIGDITVTDGPTRRQARQRCIFERAANGRPAFRAKYGEGPRQRRAMRNCIRRWLTA